MAKSADTPDPGGITIAEGFPQLSNKSGFVNQISLLFYRTRTILSLIYDNEEMDE